VTTRGTDTQYIYGIKDPFFNGDRSPNTYYHNYTSTVELTTTDLLNTDGYVVTTAHEVYDAGDTLVPNLEALVKAEDGWRRTLDQAAGERVLVKPALLGGVVFVPSFVPSADVCGYGGSSYLYGLYYLTGTAYWDPIFPDETTTQSIGGVNKTVVLDVISLGAGKASSLGLHVGLGDDATGFIQQSTGTVLQKKLNPAFNVKSGLTSWIQR
jgi:type IV pilus assembly protein PilY1